MVEANRRQISKLSVSRSEITGLSLNRLFHADRQPLCISNRENSPHLSAPSSILTVVNALKVNKNKESSHEKVTIGSAGSTFHGAKPSVQTTSISQPISSTESVVAKDDNAKWQKELKAVINSGTANGPATLLNNFIASRLSECSMCDISDIFRAFGKKSKSKSHLHLKRHLPALAIRVGKIQSPCRYKEISTIIYGLQCYKESDKGYIEIIRIASKLIKTKIQEAATISTGNLTMIFIGLQNNKFERNESMEFLSLLPLVVKACSMPLDAQSLSNMMYGMKGMTSYQPETLALLKALAPKVRECTERFKPQHVGNCLYALQGMSSRHNEVLIFLHALIPRINSCTESLSCQEFSNAFYGVQGMRSKDIGIIPLLMALNTKVKEFTYTLDGQGIGNTLYGLQGMRSDQGQVLFLLEALTPKIRSCQEPLSSLAVGTALYGLQGMSSSFHEVRLMISALTVQVKKNIEPLSGVQVGNAMFGLRNMSSDHAEVRDLLVALTVKVRTCEEKLNSKSLASSLYGLQSLSSDHVEVLQLLSAIEVKVRTCTGTFNDIEIGTALSGLQGMNSDHPEVLSLLLAITEKIEGPLSTWSLGMALYGLQGLLNTPTAQPLLEKILDNTLKLSNNDVKSSIAVLSLGQAICFSLPSFRNTMDSEKINQWDERLYFMRKNFNKEGLNNSFRGRALHVENEVYRVIVDALKNTDIEVEVSNKKHLYDFFECDIVIDILPKDSKKGVVINIEIDGCNHAEQRKIRFTNLRDAYLKSMGVVVVRQTDIDIKSVWSGELRDWVLNIVAESLRSRDLCNK